MSIDTEGALGIAKTELRKCYTNDGIIAGTHHFTDHWARDGYFACFGAISIGDIEIVKKQIELFYKFQRSDGLIPYRIMRGPVDVKKYLGKPKFYKNLKPTYRLRGVGCEVLDGTILTILFTAILAKKNLEDFKIDKQKIIKSLNYLIRREKHGLLYDGVMAEWNDTALKYGNLLYSNIIYWYMYKNLSEWAERSDINWYNELSAKTDEVASNIRKRLWNGSFFADWHDYKRQDYFYPFGNCLAIAWGFTTKDESEFIFSECKKVGVLFTLETNSPKYPFPRIDPLQILAGMGDYQNKSMLW